MSADYGPIECGKKPMLVKHISIVPEWYMVPKMGDGKDQSGSKEPFVHECAECAQWARRTLREPLTVFLRAATRGPRSADAERVPLHPGRIQAELARAQERSERGGPERVPGTF